MITQTSNTNNIYKLMQKGKSYIKTPEAARRLAVTTQTIRRWIRDGELRGRRIGRNFQVEEKAVEEMAAGRPEAAAA